MPAQRTRPLLAVRLIGTAETVGAAKSYLVNYYAKLFRHQEICCRVSTHPAKYAGEVRTYVTITPKEVT